MVRHVRHPALRPQRCAFIPYLGASNEPGGFFDFGSEMFGGDHPYCSWTAFMEMCRVAQFGPKATADSPEVVDLRERVDVAESRVAALEAQLAAVETLKRGGFETARRPGRPKGTAKQVDRVREAAQAVGV